MSAYHPFIAFAAPFEESPTYAAYTMPSATQLQATLASTAAVAALSPQEHSMLHFQLALRTLAIAQCWNPPAESVALLTRLPEVEQSLRKAIELDEKNGHAKVVLAQCVSTENAEDACVVALENDLSNIYAMLMLLNAKVAAASTSPVRLLDVSVRIAGQSKTVGEWLQHCAAVDEYDADLWATMGKILAVESVRIPQLRQRERAENANIFGGAPTTDAQDDADETAIGAGGADNANGQEEATLTVNGVAFTSVMCFIRRANILCLVAQKFGIEAVSGLHFARVGYGRCLVAHDLLDTVLQLTELLTPDAEVELIAGQIHDPNAKVSSVIASSDRADHFGRPPMAVVAADESLPKKEKRLFDRSTRANHSATSSSTSTSSGFVLPESDPQTASSISRSAARKEASSPTNGTSVTVAIVPEWSLVCFCTRANPQNATAWVRVAVDLFLEEVPYKTTPTGRPITALEALVTALECNVFEAAAWNVLYKLLNSPTLPKTLIDHEAMKQGRFGQKVAVQNVTCVTVKGRVINAATAMRIGENLPTLGGADFDPEGEEAEAFGWTQIDATIKEAKAAQRTSLAGVPVPVALGLGIAVGVGAVLLIKAMKRQ